MPKDMIIESSGPAAQTEQPSRGRANPAPSLRPEGSRTLPRCWSASSTLLASLPWSQPWLRLLRAMLCSGYQGGRVRATSR